VLRSVPLSVARIVSGPGCTSSLDTQRILFAWSASGGACKASRGAQRMATIVPCAPTTCGMAWSGGSKPERAQTGSGLMVGAAEQPPPAAGAELVLEGALALLADDRAGPRDGPEVHAATARMARTRSA
jgi:hypothetical protein